MLKPSKIILASASKRRAQILASCGLEFEVVHSSAQEMDTLGKGGAKALAEHNALIKGADVANRNPYAMVISADTVVVCGKKLYGKPKDEADARRFLEVFSGRRIRVVSGVAVTWKEKGIHKARVDTSLIAVRRMSPAERAAFFPHLAPYDKAGGFSIEGAGSMIFDNIKGSYFNILGLPMGVLYDLCRLCGVALM